MTNWVYDENQGQIDLDADPNAATRWANIPGGTGSWDSIKSLFYNAARPQDVPHDALAKAGFVINPDGTLTRAQIRDAGIAAQQDAEAGFMNGGWIPGVIGGALAGGLTGMIPGTTAFGAGGAGAAGGSFLSDLPSWAGGAQGVADTALGGGLGGTGLGGASLAGSGLTTATGVGTGFAGSSGIGIGSDVGTGISFSGTDQIGTTGTGTGTGTGTTTTTGTGATAADSAQKASSLSRILKMDGSATAEDYLKVFGTVGSTIASAITGNDTANSLQKLYDQNMAIGAPSRARYEASYAPGFDLAAADPAYQGALDQSMNAYLRKASTGGNPFSNPGVSMEANKYVTQNTALPWLQNYRNQNASSGGMQSFSTAAPGSGQTAAVNQNQGFTNLFGGLSDLFNPQQKASSFEDLLKQYGYSPTKVNTGDGVVSDRRLKTEIKRVGSLDNGLNVYSYRYIMGGPIHIGVMADEVEEIIPEAVGKTNDGFSFVDYGRL